MAHVIATNASHLPVSLVAMWGDATLADVEAMRRFYDACHAQERRFATLVDSRRSAVPSVAVRRALADMSNDFAERAKKHTVCVAVILDSKVLIGVLTAVRWFMRDNAELHYFPTAKDGLAWIEVRLARESLPVPPAARALVARLDSTDDVSFLSVG